MTSRSQGEGVASPYTIVAIFGTALLMLLSVVWFVFHGLISYYVLYWKWIEALPFAWIPGFKGLVARMVSMAPYSANLGPLDLLSAIYPTSFFWAPLPVFLAWKFSRKALTHPLRAAKRLHTPQTLMEAHVKNFSAIAPIIDRDLTRENPPEWRSSEDPDTYAQKLRLVRSDRTFDRQKALELLAKDLGPLHDNDPRKWKPHEQALFAVFCDAIFNEDGFADAEQVIDQLNYSARNKKHLPNFSVANKLWHKWLPQIKTHPDLSEMMQRHRYVRTLLYALLFETTDCPFYEHTNKGVFNPAQFIWLKPTDRALWYPLHNVGMKVPMVEAGAVFGQYRNEILAWNNASILMEPALEEAMIGWEEECYRCGLTKTNPRDNSSSWDEYELQN